MDPVEPHIHSFIVKVWQEVVVGNGDELGWRGYVTHVPSGARRYFEDLAEISGFVEPTLLVEAIEAAIHEGQPGSVDDEVERTGGTAPGPGEGEMDSAPSGVELLKDKLSKGDADVDKAEDDAAKAQLKLKRRRDTQATLQQTLDALVASHGAIKKASDAAAGPRATALQTFKDLEQAIGSILTPVQTQAVDQKVKASADTKAGLEQAQQQAKAKVDEQQTKADEASNASATAEAKLAGAQSQVKDRAASITALTAKVTATSSAAKAALDAKRPGEAHRLNTVLKRALDDLEAALKAGPEELERAVGDAWTEVAGERNAAAVAADALAAAKANQKTSDDALASFTSTADKTLNDQIAALERQWATAASTTPSGGSGSKTTTPRQTPGSPGETETPEGGSSYGETPDEETTDDETTDKETSA